MYRHKRKTRQEPQAELSARELRQRLTVTGGVPYAGLSAAGVRDRFRQSFDQFGQANAEKRQRGANPRQANPQQTDPQQGGPLPSGARQQAGAAGGTPVGRKLRGYPSQPLPLQRFSDVAFRRGNLAGSILQGTGKMMMVSCIRRTMNPRRPMPHDALTPGTKRLPVKGEDPDALTFTRDLVRGAVSIVVDTIHDSRRTLNTMAETIRDGGPGAAQLYTMYPFLDDSPERELREQCLAALAEAHDEDRRAALQSALVHAEAAIESKDRMRVDFLACLRRMSAQAKAAEEEFEAPGFEESLTQAVLSPEEDEPLPPPPPDGEGKGGEGQGDGDGAQEPEREGPAALHPESASQTGDGPGA